MAPEYPDFGHSSAPAPADFGYAFEHLAEVTSRFADALGIEAASCSLSARHEQMGGLNARSWSLTRSQQMPLNGCGRGVLAANRRTLSRHTAV